jgi:WD40 repeat protein
MNKLILFTAVLLTLVITLFANLPQQIIRAEEPIKISIFLGLGTGTNPQQFEVENKLVDEWNAANKDIQLALSYCNHCTAHDAFMTTLLGGEPPDIAAAVGTFTFYELIGSTGENVWADLTPYIERDKAELGLDDYEPRLLKIYQLAGKQLGLPYHIFPSFLYINKELFEAAGVELPPTEYGPSGTATYQGKPWDMAALRELGIRLTRDKNGKFGNEPGFDTENIVSYGYQEVWSSLREWTTHFSPSDNGLDSDLKTATFNRKIYLDASQYLHDAIFKDHWMPDLKAQEKLNENGIIPWATGGTAMAYSHTWFTCCITDAKFEWTTAVAPTAPNGKLTARLHAATFGITDKSKHKDAAWKVLKWLYSPEVALQLNIVYGGLPARKSIRAAWEQQIGQTMPQYAKLNSKIMNGAIPYADVPNNEGYLPEMPQTREALNVFWNALQSDPALDIPGELRKLTANIQQLFNEKDPVKNKKSQNTSKPGVMLPIQTAEITSVAYSPDGKTILTGRDDGTVRLWDAQTSKVRYTLAKHRAGPVSVAYSPDNKTMLTGGVDKTIVLWDLETGAELFTFKLYSPEVTSLAFSPDGKLALSGSKDSTVDVWDMQNRKLLYDFVGHTDSITDVAFSPDGKTAVSASADKTAQLWDIQTGQTLMKFIGHQDAVTSVVFAPNGKTILTGSDDDTAKLWQVETGRNIQTYSGHIDEVFDVAYAPDGLSVVTASCDKTAKLWDIHTGKLIQTFEGHTEGVVSIEFSRDGKTVLTGSEDRTVRLWDVSTASTVRTFPAHLGYMESLAFSPDGKMLLTGGGDATARLWDVQNGKLTQTFKGHSASIFTMGWATDSKTILTGGEDGTARLWDVQTGKPLNVFQTQLGTSAAVASAAFAPDGSIMTGTKDFTIRFWNPQTGTMLRSFYMYGIVVSAMGFSADGSQVVVGNNEGKLYFNDLKTGTPIQPTALSSDSAESQGVTSIAFSANGKWLAASKDNNSIEFWDVEHTTQGSSLGLYGRPRLLSVAFSADGKLLLVGLQDGTVQLYDFDNSYLLHQFEGHSEGVISLAFSPDGSRIATGSMDGSVRIWDTATYELLHEIY